MRFPNYVFLSATLFAFALSGCDALQPKPETPKSEAEKNLKPPQSYHYKETVQVDREVLSYGGKYSCSEELVEQKGKKKPKTEVKVDERPRAIQVEKGYYRSLIERPCYFKGKETSLKPVHYKAKKSGDTTIGTPLVVCPNAESARSGYDEKSSGCKRVSGALVSFEAWE